MADQNEDARPTFASLTIVDRRRAGRVEYTNPHLIALLRDQERQTAAQFADVPASDSLDPESAGRLTGVSLPVGTRLLTDRGPISVEHLKQDQTLSGWPQGFIRLSEARLAGKRPDWSRVAPAIRVEPGAVADDCPNASLLLHPDHCLFIGGILIAPRLMLTPRSIATEEAPDTINWIQLTMSEPTILTANGTQLASWINEDERAIFQVGGTPILNAEFAFTGNGPFLVRPQLDRVLRDLRWRGRTKAARLWLSIAGKSCSPLVSDGPASEFVVARPTGGLTILFGFGRPGAGFQHERIAIERMIVTDADQNVQEIPVDHPALTGAFGQCDQDGYRIYRSLDGIGYIPGTLFADMQSPVRLRVVLTAAGPGDRVQ